MSKRSILVLFAIMGFWLSVEASTSGAPTAFPWPSPKLLPDSSISKRVKLVSELLENYPKYMRPVLNESTTTTVIHGMSLIHVIDMDEKNQIIQIVVWFRQYWRDEYLTWTPKNFDGIKEIRIPFALIWQPDIVLYNSGSEDFQKIFTTEAIVDSEGMITAFSPSLLKCTCKIDATYFPFDIQSCDLKFGSWSYHGYLIDLAKELEEGETSQFQSNGEWNLIRMDVKRNVLFYPCCVEPFMDITYTIHLRRRSLFYVVSIILPCMLISVLIILGFYLPPESGEKVTMSVTCMLSLMVFLMVVSDTMPPTSDNVPYIATYFITVIGLVTLSCIMTALILNIHSQGPMCREVPHWVRKLVFSILAPLVCKGGDRYRTRGVGFGSGNHSFQSSSAKTASTALNELLDYGGGGGGGASYDPDTLANKNGVHEMLAKIVQQNAQLNRHIQYVTSDMEKNNRSTEIQNEWKEVAKIADRVLMLLFMVMTLALSISVTLILTGESREPENN